jgi:hypothetical protein
VDPRIVTNGMSEEPGRATIREGERLDVWRLSARRREEVGGEGTDGMEGTTGTGRTG